MAAKIEVEKAEEEKKKKPVKKTPVKPLAIRAKQIIKIKREVREYYFRARELFYYEHIYTPLTDSILYTVITPYGRLDGGVNLLFLATLLRLSSDKFREYLDEMWTDVADAIASKVITLSELDKTIPPDVEDTEIIDISAMYETEITSCLKRVLGR